MEFIAQNALLIGLAIGSGLAIIWPMLGRNAGGVPTISVTEAVMLLSRNKPLVIDVREAEEFASGHIQGAKNISLKEITNKIKEIEKHKNKPVLVNCQRGMRSKSACSILKAQGFMQLHNLDGGLDAWAQANMPMIKEAV